MKSKVSLFLILAVSFHFCQPAKSKKDDNRGLGLFLLLNQRNSTSSTQNLGTSGATFSIPVGVAESSSN